MRVVRPRMSFVAVAMAVAAAAAAPARAEDPAAPPPPPPPGLPAGEAGPWAPAPALPQPFLQGPPTLHAGSAHRREELPRTVVHRPGMPVFAGYHLEEKSPRWPLALGLPFFGVGYVAAFAIALMGGSISGRPDSWAPMFAPVVGPFIALETAKRTIEFDGERVVMVASALFQVTGLSITALRFALPATKVLVLDRKIEARAYISPAGSGLVATF